MRNRSPVPDTSAGQSSDPNRERSGSAAPPSTEQNAGDPTPAAQDPRAEPQGAAANPSPAPRTDSPAEAEGRRTLSTAFVRVGPDGHLTVELRNGRTMVLRDVVMRANDYCGVQVLGGPAGKKYCGGYGDIAAARPGGGPLPGTPDPDTINPVGHAPGPRQE